MRKVKNPICVSMPTILSAIPPFCLSSKGPSRACGPCQDLSPPAANCGPQPLPQLSSQESTPYCTPNPWILSSPHQVLRPTNSPIARHMKSLSISGRHFTAFGSHSGWWGSEGRLAADKWFCFWFVHLPSEEALREMDKLARMRTLGSRWEALEED